MARLALIFIVVPLIELALLIAIGSRLGLAPTLALVVVTGLLGAWLARRQGLAVLRSVRAELAMRRVPAGQLADGVLILVAGALLITPGVLTDAFGFFCLLPAGRRVLKRAMRRWVEGMIQRGTLRGEMRLSELRIADESLDVTPADND